MAPISENDDPAGPGNNKSSLVLVPTQLELDCVAARLSRYCVPQVCGFGVVASGVETARLLSRSEYQDVLLIGIAGSYNQASLATGSACSFQRVGCFGIGVGEGDSDGDNGGDGFRTAGEIGMVQTRLESGDCYDELPLVPAGVTQDMLLTVCSAASGPRQVESRLKKFPSAVAEDMEAFSVALAAARFGLGTTVIRGISNLAGDRDHSGWQVQAAMDAAVDLLDSMVT